MTNEDLAALQKDCGIPHMPTQFTAELRLAVAGEGPRAYDWSDKPHRLLYDACCEIERMMAVQNDVRVVIGPDAVERAIEAVTRELGTTEMVLTDPLTLRRLKAVRCVQAAIAALTGDAA